MPSEQHCWGKLRGHTQDVRPSHVGYLPPLIAPHPLTHINPPPAPWADLIGRQAQCRQFVFQKVQDASSPSSAVLEVGDVREDHGRSQLQVFLQGGQIRRIHTMNFQPIG